MGDPTPFQRVERALDEQDCRPTRGRARQGRASLRALCPAHDDHDPSLDVDEKPDGTVLVTCRSGCDPSRIVGELGLTLADLFPPKAAPARLELVASYAYHDESANPVFEVRRFWDEATHRKTFRQYHADGTPGLNGCRRVPYRLPQLLAAIADGSWVLVVEGEKDVQSCEAAGLVATCNAGGAGKGEWGEWAEWFRGARVAILPDNDDPGRAHAEMVATALAPVASVVKVVQLDVGPKGDITDWLETGHSAADLSALIASAPPWAPVSVAPYLTYEDAWALAREDNEDPGWLAEGIIVRDAYGVIGATKKAGKTWLGLDLAVSVASGTAWCGIWACTSPGPVLYFLGEGGRRATKRRLKAIMAAKGVLSGHPIHLCHRSPQIHSNDDLEAMREQISATRPALVVIDPAYLALARAETSSLTQMGELLHRIQIVCQDAGAALLFIHHWNKTGNGSGSDRFSGAGFAEWGRFLISVDVVSRQRTSSGGSLVKLSLDIEGGEVADDCHKLLREVWSDDPASLASDLHYRVSLLDDSDSDESLSRLELQVLDALRARLAESDAGSDPRLVWWTPGQLASDSRLASTNKLRDALKALALRGLVQSRPRRNSVEYRAVFEEPTP